jgi:hypothetical protein
MVNPLFAPIWQCKAPLKFKIYAWKVVCGRCWTGDRRRHHGLTTDDTCPLCLQDCETTDHLLLRCPYSRTIWFEVLKGLGEPGLPPSGRDSLLQWWPSVLGHWSSKSVAQVRALSLLVLRSIWLERNARIFKN